MPTHTERVSAQGPIEHGPARFERLRHFFIGMGLSLLGIAMAVAIISVADWLEFRAGIALFMAFGVLPGALRALQLFRAHRRQAGKYALMGSVLATAVMTLLGLLIVAIAVGSGMPRHD